MIKLAIIGTGRMGTYHTRVAAANPHITVTALVNRSAPVQELVALVPDAIVQTDHGTVIKAVDAAIIATPTPTHFAIARDFLAAGKHVLVEKPVTLSYQEAEELFTLATQNNVAFHIGHVERYNPAFMALQESITTQPLLIRATRSGPFHPRVGHDSVVMDLMIHDIDLILKLTGQAPNSIHTMGMSHVSAQPDTAVAQMNFANSTIATITVHRGAASATREIIVEEQKQTLHADLGTRALHIRTGSDNKVIAPPEGANPLATQLTAFVEAIKSENDLRNAEHDLGVLQATLAAEEQVQVKNAPLMAISSDKTALTS